MATPTAEQLNFREVNAHTCYNCCHSKGAPGTWYGYAQICDRWPTVSPSRGFDHVGDDPSSLLRYTCDGWEAV